MKVWPPSLKLSPDSDHVVLKVIDCGLQEVVLCLEQIDQVRKTLDFRMGLRPIEVALEQPC
jgi:hypothetical protein